MTEDNLRMDAYYYGFDPTNVKEIDLILSAVACAGKLFHHTRDWNDEVSPYGHHEGQTPTEWIQFCRNKSSRPHRGVGSGE